MIKPTMKKLSENDIKQYEWMMESRKDTICNMTMESAIFIFSLLLLLDLQEWLIWVLCITASLISIYAIVRRARISFGKKRAHRYKAAYLIIAFQGTGLLALLACHGSSTACTIIVVVLLAIHIVSILPPLFISFSRENRNVEKH